MLFSRHELQKMRVGTWLRHGLNFRSAQYRTALMDSSHVKNAGRGRVQAGRARRHFPEKVTRAAARQEKTSRATIADICVPHVQHHPEKLRKVYPDKNASLKAASYSASLACARNHICACISPQFASIPQTRRHSSGQFVKNMKWVPTPLPRSLTCLHPTFRSTLTALYQKEKKLYQFIKSGNPSAHVRPACCLSELPKHKKATGGQSIRCSRLLLPSYPFWVIFNSPAIRRAGEAASKSVLKFKNSCCVVLWAVELGQTALPSIHHSPPCRFTRSVGHTDSAASFPQPQLKDF